MPSITINTTTQESGISYAWDRDYDIKTVSEAQAKYLSLREQLAAIPQELAKMEGWAAADGFALPTEDFGALVEQLAGELLRPNPGKLLRLLPAEDSCGPLSFSVPLILPAEVWRQSSEGETTEAELSELAPEILVNEEGRAWSTCSLHAQREAHDLLRAGSYQLLTLEDFFAAFPE